jgi:hypothetical protein
MGVSAAAKGAFILIVLFLVSACGELETLFPSNGSYQVRTMVNGVPIEECSIIRSGDKIRPYFAVSVEDDPDLIGLLVYFQDSQGKISGGKIKYTTRPSTDDIPQTETKTQEEAKQDTDEAVSEQTETSGETKIDARAAAIALEEEQKKEIEIAVKSLDQELPHFPLSPSLEIGSYTLVFEALGNRETLSRTEINIFYLGNAEFNLKDIAMYMPGLSSSQLIPPSTTVLLEARLDFDSRLDPYVIWYNGKNIISEGKTSDGAGSILWVAPEQAGFYSLRLEALPFQLKRSFTGIYRGIALPVSTKAVDMGYFFRNDSNHTAQSPLAEGTAYPELVAASMQENSDNENTLTPLSSLPPELLQWYQFEGSLDSSMPLPDDEQSLLPVNNKKTPRWAGAGQSYGLSTSSDDAYQLPLVSFFHGNKGQGGGIFLSHVRLPSEGTILSAFFPLKSSTSEGAWIEMISEGNIVALVINAGGAAIEIPVYLDISELQGFVPIVTEFYVRPYRLEARITLGEDLKSNAGVINLPIALSGEGRIRMGGQEKFKREGKLSMPIPVAKETVKPTASAEDENADNPETDEALLAWMESRETNTIWDEFAILLSAVPLFPEEIFEESPVAEVSGKETVVITVPSVLYAPAVSIIPEADDEGTSGDENLLFPVADINMNEPVQEPEMLSVLPEES